MRIIINELWDISQFAVDFTKHYDNDFYQEERFKILNENATLAGDFSTIETLHSIRFSRPFFSMLPFI